MVKCEGFKSMFPVARVVDCDSKIAKPKQRML